MEDNFDDDPGVFDFEELAGHMLDQGLQASPSAVHGCQCGLLAAGASHEQEYCLDALVSALDLPLHGELAGQVMQLYSTSLAALRDEDFGFHPLLPEDDAGMGERVEALADWCKGFLAGFAHASASSHRVPEALSEDSSEILKDFAEIAQAGLEEHEDEEDSENSYMELVEYLRFATLNLFMDNGEEEPEPGGDSTRLH